MRSASTREVQDRKILVKVNDLAGKKSTYPGVYSGLLPQRDPDASCTNIQETTQGWLISGQKTIGGHPTDRLVRPHGARTFPGEPDPALFQFPAAFAEVPPSRLFTCPERDGKCPGLPLASQQWLDSASYSARGKAGLP